MRQGSAAATSIIGPLKSAISSCGDRPAAPETCCQPPATAVPGQHPGPDKHLTAKARVATLPHAGAANMLLQTPGGRRERGKAKCTSQKRTARKQITQRLDNRRLPFASFWKNQNPQMSARSLSLHPGVRHGVPREGSDSAGTTAEALRVWTTHKAHSACTHSVQAHRQGFTAGPAPESRDPLNQTWHSDKNLLVICMHRKSLQSPNLRRNKECVYFILMFFSKILSKFN